MMHKDWWHCKKCHYFNIRWRQINEVNRNLGTVFDNGSNCYGYFELLKSHIFLHDELKLIG